MTNSSTNKWGATNVTPQTADESHKILLKEIGAKWGKFSEQDTAAMKSRDDLVTNLVAKYSMEKEQAQRGSAKPGNETPVRATKDDRLHVRPETRKITGVTVVMRDLGRTIR